MSNRVYQKYLVSLSQRVTLIDLVEIYMLNFDLILGIHRLPSCYAFIDYSYHVVKFQFPDVLILKCKKGKFYPERLVYFMS